MSKNKKELLPIDKSNKAYDNLEFIHSREGRVIRLVAEYLHPEQDLRKKGVKGTIVFYGSARVLSQEKYEHRLKELKEKLHQAQRSEIHSVEKEIEALKNNYDLTKYYEDGVHLSNMLVKWIKSTPQAKGIKIASGGGPGMMEAANKGSYLANETSVGFNISLPFEQYPNPYMGHDLNFEFHYFFMRKFWFVYLAKAIITMPGGFGTLDEIMEILTLRQTLKVTKPLPIVLYGSEFWKKLINFDYLIEKKLIAEKDMNIFKFCDTPQEAFNYITGELKNNFSRKKHQDTIS